MITSGSSQIFGRATAWARALAIALLVGVMGMAQALDTQVNIFSVYAAAEEEGATPGQFLITRNDATNAVTVNFSVTGTADFSDDYTVPAFSGTFSGTAGLPTATGSITFAAGVVSATIVITPVDDLDLEGGESISITLTPSASYQLGSYSSALVEIADDDEVATITRPDNVADEDGLDAILGSDDNYGRRAVYRITWAPDTGVTPVARGRTVRVRFDDPGSVVAGIATLNTDYVVHHKIIGSNSSYIGCVTQPTGTTGYGYRVYGHLAGETVIQVAGGSGAIPGTAQVRFGDSLITYSLSASNTTNGIGTITLSGVGLLENIANDAEVTVITTGTAPTGYRINVPYPAGTQTVKVGGGENGIRVGDVFRVVGDASSHYVVTASTVGGGSSGSISFRRYLPNNGGLSTAIEGVEETETYFVTTLAGASGNVATIDIPAESDRIEFSITPKLTDTTGAEGAETVTMTMDKSLNYAINDPTSSTVIIADADVSASIITSANAQRPSTSGKFLVTFTGGPFPTGKNVDVRYVVSGTGISGTDYEVLDGLLVIPAGSSTGEIEVKPISPGTAGTQTVTVTLLNSYDFVLSGSAGSGANASATLNISDSAGQVSIAANPTDAQEAPTPTTSFFTVTLARSSAGPINVNYAISGSAAASRYQALGSIQISGTTTTLTVTPRDNSIADGTQDVIVTLLPGDGYGLSSTLPISAAVRIRDDEPTVSIIDQIDASKGGTNGLFTIGYPGVPPGTELTRSIRVYFELTGSAVLNTDFSTSATMTKLTPPYQGYIDIQGDQLSVDMSITGNETPADGSDKDVILTILPDAAYTIGANANPADAQLIITGTPTPSSSKPTPGTINSGSGSGGCGLGSGLATLLGFAAFALMALRSRRTT